MYANVYLFPLDRPKLTMVETGEIYGVPMSTKGYKGLPRVTHIHQNLQGSTFFQCGVGGRDRAEGIGGLPSSALTYNNVFLEALLAGDDERGLVLRRRRNLHPVVLALLHRDPVLGGLGGVRSNEWPAVLASLLEPHLFDKLVLQGFKAVKTDGSHIPVLHGDRALRLLVVPEEGEVLQDDNMKLLGGEGLRRLETP